MRALTPNDADFVSNNVLDADKIKWNWPRIKKAAVYLSLSQPNPHVPRFLCSLDPDYAKRDKRDKFNRSEIVRLRTAGPFEGSNSV